MTAPSLSPRTVCVSCGSPTGTCHAAEGDRDWITTFLIYLGLVREKAEAAMAPQAGDPPPGGRIRLVIPICAPCALRAGISIAPCLPGFAVPVTRQPEGDRP